MTPFINPYAKIPYGEQKQLVTRISETDYRFIRCIRPESATLTTVINTLWLKLCNELRKRNITTVADQERFEQFVANCNISEGDDSETVTISRADYEQLRIDSTKQQLDNIRNRGLRDRAARRSVAKGKRVDRSGETRTLHTTENASPELSDVQSDSGEQRREEGEQEQNKEG